MPVLQPLRVTSDRGSFNEQTSWKLSHVSASLKAENIGLSKDFGPNVAAYWQRLQARDGYRKAVAAETLAGEQQKVARRS